MTLNQLENHRLKHMASLKEILIYKIETMVCHRRPKTILVSVCIIAVIVSIFKIWKFKRTVISFLHMSLSFQSVAKLNSLQMSNMEMDVSWSPMISYLYSCPVCFGYGMCNEIKKGSLLLHGELTLGHNTRIIWKKGVLQTRRILISSLVSDEWKKFDEFICGNASLPLPCDLSAAIWKTSIALDDLLTAEKFKNLNALFDIPSAQFSLPVCSSRKLVTELTKSFDENLDGHFSKEEKILLLTSLLMQPGYAILKLQAQTRMTMPLPNLLGACGRSIVFEGGLKPLKSFLAESFETRAGLAIQVLQLVEDFVEEDPHWYFLYLSFSLDGIVVTKEGEVVVMDLDNMIILDKSLVHSGLQKRVTNTGLCNEVCFQKITLQLFYDPSNSSVCTYIWEFGQLMYAIICKEVLSNIGEHRAEGFFNFDGHRLHKKLEIPGLLHSIPYKVEEHFQGLLRECVQETTPNGRRLAVAELRETLENYVSIDDSGGQFSIDNIVNKKTPKV